MLIELKDPISNTQREREWQFVQLPFLTFVLTLKTLFVILKQIFNGLKSIKPYDIG